MTFYKFSQIHRDDLLMSFWWVVGDFLLFYYVSSYISDEFMMNCLKHFGKPILWLEFVEINELLKESVEIVRNYWICWILWCLMNLRFPMTSWWLSDDFLMSFWWVYDEFLMSFWWVFGSFLLFCYVSNYISDEFLMSSYWVSDESSRGSDEFLMNFSWTYMRWWVSDEFLMNFWWVFEESVVFRVFRFSTDSTKVQQNLNINHRNSTESQQIFNLTYGQSPH